jgi:cytochrome c oxidase subunit 4
MIKQQRIYFSVWISLLFLTALTVIVAGLDFGTVAVIVALAIAAGKSTLVLLYFMHLREEKRLVFKLLIPIAVAALAIFIGLTYVDILKR